MNEFQVGFSRKNIDPPLGIPLKGYYKPRYASGVLSSLYVNAAALSLGERKSPEKQWNPATGNYDARPVSGSNDGIIVLLSVDHCGLHAAECRRLCHAVASESGVPVENIIVQCTHTHTAPVTDSASEAYFTQTDKVKIERYLDFLQQRLCDAANEAIADLKPARMGVITGYAPDRIAYIRRYRMKDGSTMTCPPVNDPQIDHPIGELDQQVHVLRFDRSGADAIVMVNYGLHADCLNLDQVSADWPGWMAETFERAYPGTRVMFLNGCEGDVGSTHVFPEGGDMNDTLISFDNEMKSPGMARFVGRAMAGTILQVYDKAEFVDVDAIHVCHLDLNVPANKPDPKDLPLARKYIALHDAGKDGEIPYTAMELTTVVAEAARMLKYENGPDAFSLPLTGIQIGPVALLGIPGEPFTDIGRQIKKAKGWKCIMPMCLTNGSEGYFPMKDAFEEGGYEARSSCYKAGVAEAIVDGSIQLLDALKEKQK